MSDAGGEPIRLLYIDDDLALGRLVQKTLGRQGIAVIHATSGDAGLKLLSEERFDAVGLDHYMPDRDGLDVLEALQAFDDALPVIYATGANEGRIAVAAMKAGAADYVIKDVGGVFMDLLASAVRQAIEARDLRLARERAEAEMREARERAEMLLKEVNHRVANSLQLVGSMVAMQQRGVADPAARAALAETQGRIAAIAQIHRRLYTSADVSTVEMNAYFSGLASELEAAMSAAASGADGIATPTGHRLVLDVEPVRVTTDRAVALGVVVTELVTNAFKYAYPAGSAGEIRVRLASAPAGLELAVEDDGTGIAPDTAAKGSGLGMRVVRAMLDTLKATIEFDPGHAGTRALILLPA